MPTMKLVDMEAYVQRTVHGPCFICEMLAGNAAYKNHIIYEDEQAVVFLNKFPTLYGYTLVAPKEHREQVTGDFSRTEYLQLQELIYHVGESLREVVPTERLYLLSLGSQQANKHVHWHLAPLPPGVPLQEQQYEALRMERGVLDLTEGEMKVLAAKIGERLERRLAIRRAS